MYVEIRHHSISYHLRDKVIQSYGTLKELEENWIDHCSLDAIAVFSEP